MLQGNDRMAHTNGSASICGSHARAEVEPAVKTACREEGSNDIFIGRLGSDILNSVSGRGSPIGGVGTDSLDSGSERKLEAYAT